VRRSRRAIEMLQLELEAERLRHSSSIERLEAEAAQRGDERSSALDAALAEVERLREELKLGGRAASALHLTQVQLEAAHAELAAATARGGEAASTPLRPSSASRDSVGRDAASASRAASSRAGTPGSESKAERCRHCTANARAVLSAHVASDFLDIVSQ